MRQKRCLAVGILIIKEVASFLEIESDFDQIILNSQNEIILCIMVLLHDSRFALHNGEQAVVNLLSYPNPESENSEGNNDYIVGLGVNFPHNLNGINIFLAYVLFYSKCECKKYIQNFHYNPQKLKLSEITAKRIDGNLLLVKL